MNAGFISPMLARKVDKLPTGKDWIYEWKWDGFRAIAVRNGESVKIYSRKGRDQTAMFRGVADAVSTIHADMAIIDGEIIAISENGDVSFQHLQNRSFLPDGWHIVLCAFDLLNFEKKDVRQRPLLERRALLETVVSNSGVLLSTTLKGTPTQLMRLCKKRRMEGLIAKRADSVYDSGGRSDSWRKLPLKPQEKFIVGGYRPGGTRHLQLILVGYEEDGKLLYAGKVRNALDPFNRKLLHGMLSPLRQTKCPFENLPNSRRDHFGESVTAAEMKYYVWVRPKIAVDVKYSEWTNGNVLRHADFVGVHKLARSSHCA